MEQVYSYNPGACTGLVKGSRKKDKDSQFVQHLHKKRHKGAQVWHVFSRDLTVLPAHPQVHPQSEWAIPAFAFPAAAGTRLPTRRDGRLSRPWCEVAQAEIQTCNLSLRFNGHFPGEPALAGVYWSKERWRWWWQPDHCMATGIIGLMRGMTTWRVVLPLISPLIASTSATCNLPTANPANLPHSQ